MLPRDAVLCLADREEDLLIGLAAVLAVGAQAVWPASARALAQSLPLDVREHVRLTEDWRSTATPFDAVLQHAAPADIAAVARALAERPGPIVGLTALPPGEHDVPLHRLVVERSVSLNTAAAGGNASLMMLDDGTATTCAP